MCSNNRKENETGKSASKTSLISKSRKSGIAKKRKGQSAGSALSSQTNSKTQGRVCNKNEQPEDSLDDDLPSVLPEGYKSPHLSVQEGDEIKVWWEGDDKFYKGIARNLRTDGKRRVEYIDGEVVYHLLNRELFVLVGKALERFLANCFPSDAQRYKKSSEPVKYPKLADFLEVEHRVKVYWPLMSDWYKGVISAKDADGCFHVAYDDGDKEILRMENETFRFIGKCAPVAYSRLL